MNVFEGLCSLYYASILNNIFFGNDSLINRIRVVGSEYRVIELFKVIEVFEPQIG